MQCPSCHKEVDVKDKDVGALFTCPQCRSVYFINFDGTPEYGEVEQPSVEELKKLQNAAVPEKKKKKKKKKDDDEELDQHEVEAAEPQQPVAFELEVPPVDIPQTETPAFEIQPMENFAQPTETFSLEPAPQETFQIASEEPPIEALPTETPSIENFSYEATNEMPPANENQFQSQEAPASMPQDFSSIASEIESFGNQQTAVAGISYDLEITGLDTKESQELLREAIDDSRFGWHPDDVAREIRRGSCTFKNLTPVQAFVLARRIQFIDIEMKWKQNVLA
ncbi:hypothetical protein [Pseudobdellovibrio sp. HCB154]|uniref:hypothetical protein n=1 Tax=Pseudobdellovibrio sp. HCB154 TaxID=3386277 RepID=UPI003916E315